MGSNTNLYTYMLSYERQILISEYSILVLFWPFGGWYTMGRVSAELWGTVDWFVLAELSLYIAAVYMCRVGCLEFFA